LDLASQFAKVQHVDVKRGGDSAEECFVANGIAAGGVGERTTLIADGRACLPPRPIQSGNNAERADAAAGVTV